MREGQEENRRKGLGREYVTLFRNRIGEKVRKEQERRIGEKVRKKIGDKVRMKVTNLIRYNVVLHGFSECCWGFPVQNTETCIKVGEPKVYRTGRKNTITLEKTTGKVVHVRYTPEVLEIYVRHISGAEFLKYTSVQCLMMRVMYKLSFCVRIQKKTISLWAINQRFPSKWRENKRFGKTEENKNVFSLSCNLSIEHRVI